MVAARTATIAAKTTPARIDGAPATPATLTRTAAAAARPINPTAMRGSARRSAAGVETTPEVLPQRPVRMARTVGFAL